MWRAAWQVCAFSRAFNARMASGLKPAIRNLYADGDTVIVLFDAAGTAPGKIVNAFAFFDALEFNDLWKRVSPA